MSDIPLPEFSFEQLLNDNSSIFGADAQFYPEFVDFEAHYPSKPQEVVQGNDQSQPWADLANNDLLSPEVSQFGAHQSQDSGTNPAPENFAASSSQRQTLLSRVKPYGCDESGCVARYVRKGGLSRHKKEMHGDVEYLCPWIDCPWHRKGHGFKRMHRLVSHIWKPSSGEFHHPLVRTHCDAKLIAIDYNDSLSAFGQAIFEISSTSGSDEVIEAVGWDVRPLGPMSKYVDRIVGMWCPEDGCACFVAMVFDNIRYNLVDFRLGYHLHTVHEIGWAESQEAAGRVVSTQWPKEELQRILARAARKPKRTLA